MAYQTWKEFKKSIDKLVPDEYILRSIVVFAIDPQQETIRIEVKNEQNKK